MKKNDRRKGRRRIAQALAVLCFLILVLGSGVLAFRNADAFVSDNLFETGTVDINLNDGKPVIEEGEFLFEPGMMVEKNFFVKNQGELDFYWKLFFSDIQGPLNNPLVVYIQDGNETLYTGRLSEIEEIQLAGQQSFLKSGETRHLTIVFHFPKEEGNLYQAQNLSFVLNAKAVQAINNPDQDFGEGSL